MVFVISRKQDFSYFHVFLKKKNFSFIQIKYFYSNKKKRNGLFVSNILPNSKFYINKPCVTPITLKICLLFVSINE